LRGFDAGRGAKNSLKAQDIPVPSDCQSTKSPATKLGTVTFFRPNHRDGPQKAGENKVTVPNFVEQIPWLKLSAFSA
jgi:hypothetical protein